MSSPQRPRVSPRKATDSVPALLQHSGGLRVAARRPMGYGALQLTRGQVFRLANAVNDEKLLRLRYLDEVAEDFSGHVCAECGAEFVGIPERTEHGRLAHADLDDDARADRLERAHERANQLSPLDFSATAAARA